MCPVGSVGQAWDAENALVVILWICAPFSAACGSQLDLVEYGAPAPTIYTLEGQSRAKAGCMNMIRPHVCIPYENYLVQPT